VKVSLISNLYPPYVYGGAEMYVDQIAQRLSKRHEVSVITTKPYHGLKSFGDDKKTEGAITVHRFYPLNVYSNYHYAEKPLVLKPLWHAVDLWNPHAYQIVKRIVKEERPDIVHVHNFKGLSASVFSAVKDLGIPTIHTVHDCDLLCPRTTLLTGSNATCCTPRTLCVLYRKFSQAIKPDIVTAPSNFILDLLTQGGIFNDVEKIKLPLGIEIEANPVPKVKSATFDVLYVGRLGIHKGVHVLIESFKRFERESARLHIVGDGDGMPLFKSMAAGDERIRFYGFLPKEELRLLYGTVDVAVVPSICYEVFGLIIPECYEHGVPVIGSRSGAIPELIQDGYNGLTFDAGDVVGLTATLRKLAEEETLLETLSSNALASSRDYAMDVHITQVERVYKRTLSRGG
jgi:glycosyltransferase involved in cell wall biosynthesis